jgi:hypothetical protein
MALKNFVALIFYCNLQLVHNFPKKLAWYPFPRIPINLEVNILLKLVGRVAGWQCQTTFLKKKLQ